MQWYPSGWQKVMQARQKSDKFGKGSVQGQKMKKKYGIFPN